MSKKANHQQHAEQSWFVSAKRLSSVAILALLLLVIGFATFWKATPLHREMSGVNVPLPQASPTPLIVSKEYIYAGNKLVATKQLLEGDVTTGPEGDGILTVSDWIKLGRYAAALDTPPTGGEFRRADCAPRSSRGNGTISVSDWVQAGRYAAALDPPTVAWGPIANVTPRAESAWGIQRDPIFALALPYLSLSPILNMTLKSPWSAVMTRTVRVVSPTFVAGQNGTVVVELDSQGNENGLGLSLNFNTGHLTYVSAVKGSDASAGSLQVNSTGASNGRIGLAVALSSGQNFTSGTRQVLVVTFSAVTSGSHVVSTGNQPIYREVADASANPLEATFTP